MVGNQKDKISQEEKLSDTQSSQKMRLDENPKSTLSGIIKFPKSNKKITFKILAIVREFDENIIDKELHKEIFKKCHKALRNLSIGLHQPFFKFKRVI